MNVEIKPKDRVAGATFSAWRGEGHVSILEVLLALGPGVLGLAWTVDAEFAPLRGESSRLAGLSDSGEAIGSVELLRLVADDVQVIDGSFIGRSSEAGEELEVRSICGDAWDVVAIDRTVLDRVAAWFVDAQQLPS